MNPLNNSGTGSSYPGGCGKVAEIEVKVRLQES
jgi:hypothetical protein